jgi:hypothetical protein
MAEIERDLGNYGVSLNLGNKLLELLKEKKVSEKDKIFLDTKE